MLRATISSVIAIVAITVVFGLAYPLVMTGLGQAAFSHQANGSLIEQNGKVVGSTLAAQAFTSDRYFHPRPTATTPPYTVGGTWMGGDTTFANLGPTNPTLAQNVQKEAQAILKLEGPYNPGLTIHDIPVDAVTTSGSGIDPDISPANAQLQAHRIAAVRHLPLATVEQLISRYTTGRSWGFFGEPGVNVLELNLALDRQGTT
jgi:potassium-transporting ATPase KdpC subunit